MPHDAPLPAPARALGLAGLIPFVALSLAVLVTDDWQRALALRALAFYGAVILTFLGGVHWGLALADPGAQAAARARLVLGVLPGLWAWIVIVLLQPSLACLGLALGIGTVLAVEEAGLRRGLVPVAYQRLRRVLSLAASVALLASAVATLAV